MRPAALLAFLFLTAGACSDGPTLEQQIIGVINEMEHSAESADRKAFMGRVAVTFSGQQGGMTRDDFQRFMFIQWNRHRRLYAQLFPITVSREGVNTAGAAFKVLITGGQGLIPERGQMYDVETTWVQEGGEWLLLKADWVPVGMNPD